MKFSKETISLLKNFSGINSGIKFTPGKFIMTRSVNGTTYADATISDEIDAEFSIYELTGFLGILSLVGDDAEVTIQEDGNLAIKDTRSTIYWPVADPSTIVCPKAKAEFPTAKVIVDFKGEDLQQLLRISRGMNIDTIAISNKDDKIVLNGFNKIEDPSLARSKYELTLGNYDGENNFNFVINMANMKMQPGDYKLLLWAKMNGEKKQTAAKFEGSNISYIIAMEVNSTFDFE